MKQFLLFFSLILSVFSYGQQQVFSRAEVNTGNWDDGLLPWFYEFSNEQPNPDNDNTIANLIRIGHNNNTTMTLNGRSFRAKELILQSGASTDRIFEGNTLELRHQSGGPSKIENQSNGSHTFNNSIAIFDGVTELNPVSGNLSFTGNVLTNGNFIDVYGDNGNILNLSGVVSGTGGIALKQNSTIEIGAAMTYTGGTAIEGGTFRLLTGGDLSDDTNVTISNNATFDLNGQNTTVRSVSETSIGNGGFINLGSGTLTIGGGYTNPRFQNSISGSGNLIKSGTGSLSLYGSQDYTGNTTVNEGVLSSGSQMATSSIIINSGGRFNANANNTLQSTTTVEINSGGELRFSADQIIDNLTVSGTLIIDSGVTLTINDVITNNGTIENNGNITFKSTAANTAQYGSSSGTITGTGNITIERYMTNNRAFRLISSATGGQSIANAWQENTHITGTGGSTNGFDETETNNPSLFTFDNSLVDQSNRAGWQEVTSTTSEVISAGTPYRLYIRGDRTIDLNDNNASSATTIRATGAMQRGSFSPTLSSTGGNYSFVGNPYQAVVDFSLVTKTNLTDFIYVWDVNQDPNGGYVTLDLSQDPIAPDPSSSDASEFIAPGQAFFVRNTSAGNGSITFNETHKATGEPQVSVFNTYSNFYINSRLYKIAELQNGKMESDAIGLRFSDDYTTLGSDEDAGKLANPGENYAIFNNGFRSIDKQGLPSNGHEVNLVIANYKESNYSLTFAMENKPESLKVFLNDAYLSTKTELSDASTYDFTVDENISESVDQNRFNLSFEEESLSNQNFNEANLRIYPNPVVNQLNIEVPSSVEVKVVKLYNMLGQEVKSVTSASVGVSDLNSGVYLVEIQTNQGKLTEKVIKQ
ncbi:T9SS type A sorting domain-containing protein [Psychroflexus sediminis]|uniref:Por secretion system C-terminal sorting domain-containing protein n=1 Tax=Psychroflexus sediminis TaxID=470826 RepID=A0A1G7TX44_9FLAO|nr:T9SS type A sorting domain-containing protein [Psychroflexus sediminis]SDG39584.1 Por secretion system C-terminal sorting domain-containing protein [Psychroflexus sediminis]